MVHADELLVYARTKAFQRHTRIKGGLVHPDPHPSEAPHANCYPQNDEGIAEPFPSRSGLEWPEHGHAP